MIGETYIRPERTVAYDQVKWPLFRVVLLKSQATDVTLTLMAEPKSNPALASALFQLQLTATEAIELGQQLYTAGLMTFAKNCADNVRGLPF